MASKAVKEQQLELVLHKNSKIRFRKEHICENEKQKIRMCHNLTCVNAGYDTGTSVSGNHMEAIVDAAWDKDCASAISAPNASDRREDPSAKVSALPPEGFYIIGNSRGISYDIKKRTNIIAQAIQKEFPGL